MENSLINTNTPLDSRIRLKPHSSSPLSNGKISNYQNDGADDIEMIAIGCKNYTSLKDLIPASPPSTASPTCSWRENIPIKDPLLQHAAWAYLQPMTAMPDENDRWWTGLLKRCCGLFGCFNDVVLVVLKVWFTEQESDGAGAGADAEDI